MADDIQEITSINVDLSQATPRLEHLVMPNGVTYKVGLSLEEQEAIVTALSDLNDNINAVNDDVESLKEDELVVSTSLNDLNSRVLALESGIAEIRTLLQQRYMAFYDVDASSGIVENNNYTIQ